MIQSLVAFLVLLGVMWPLQPAAAQTFAIRGRIATRGLVMRTGNQVGGDNPRPTLVEYDERGQKYDLCPRFPMCQDLEHSGFSLGGLDDACAAQPNPSACKQEHVGKKSFLYKAGKIEYGTSNLIAYETDFFTVEKGETLSTNCVLDEKNPPNTNLDDARTRKFVQCNTPNMMVDKKSRVWAPVIGANVELVNYRNFREGGTDINGYYEIPYAGRVNTYEDLDINAIVTAGGLEPRVRSAKKFFLTAQAVSGYVDYPGLAAAAATDLSTGRGTMYANIPLEAAILTVHLEIANPGTDQEGKPIYLRIRAVGYGDTAITHYDNTERTDYAQGGQIGLLKEISTPDLRDTEIYVYRVADGKLIGSRWGMTDSEVASSTCFGNACLVSSMLMRGPASLYTGHFQSQYNAAAYMPPVSVNGQVVADARGIELDYGSGVKGGRVPFLREGDQAKIIAINRATGYMGSALVQMRKSIVGTMDFVPAGIGPDAFVPVRIKLTPPNLKVTVTRKAEIAQGATRTTADKEYVVGFEGSGLTSDKIVEIRTEWLDTDGSPLPEDLPGFTGRLAMTVGREGDNTKVELQPTAKLQIDNIEDRTGFFNIKPGLHPVVIRLKDSTHVDTNHFYVHVDAQPMTRLVDFTGRAGPSKPDFTVKEACIQAESSAQTWQCAGAGALAQRPQTYVPFLTAKYNDDKTKEARRASGATIAPPQYDWLYRPEMQFSLFALDMQQVNLTNSDGTQRNVLNAETAPGLYSADSMLRFLYRLDAPKTAALADIDGAPRKLAFNLGSQFADATFSQATGQISTVEAKNGMSARDFLALRLLQRGDEANVLWEYGFADLRIYIQHEGKDVANIPIGKTSRARAKFQPESLEKTSVVQWEIFDPAPGVIAKIDRTTGVITVPEGSAEGLITVQAKVDEHLFTRVRVMVGCQCKTCNTPGGCTLRVGSVDMTFHLGTTQDGLSAGDLYIHSKEVGADAFKRAAVQLSTLDTGAEGVSDKKGLSQVVTPSTFVQIEDSPDGNGYELSFYPPSVKTSNEKDQVTGLYPVALTDVDALAKWRIFDPGPGQGGTKRLRVQEKRGSGSVPKNHEYEWNETANTWSLTEGDGLRKETRTEQVIGETRVERTTISDGAGAVASVVERTYERFDWGESIVKEVRDPDGVALTTLTGYYENADEVGSFGQIQYQIEPDGNWVRYSYDDHRRIVTEQRPWLDSPSDPFSGLPSQGHLTQYSYASLDGRDIANGNADEEQQIGFSEPRVTAERINGTLVALTYRSIRNAGIGGREDIEERCPSAGSSFGDGSCLRATTTYYQSNHGSVEGGKPASIIQPDGRMDSYSYERGSWNGSSFAAGEGNAIRTMVTHGTQNSPQGVADKTTREVSVVDELGRGVRDESYIYTGGGHVLVSWSDREYDALGHLVRTRHSTGEEERASWGCCTQDSTTDSRGTMSVYDRDALERLRSSTRAGVTTTYTYDAEGRVLQTTRSGGGLSLTSSSQYDGVGRVIASVDDSGLTTSHVYTLGGRITTTTRPGGFTEVSEQSLDGQTKSVTGDSVVAQYYSHAVQPDGTRVTEVRTARPDSPMFERTYTDMLGRTVRIERPGFAGSLEVATTSYDAAGHVVRTTSTGNAATLFEYDSLGEQTRMGLDVDGSGALGISSMDRISESETKFASVDGAYWQQSSQRVYVEDSGATAKTTGVTRTRLTGLGGGLINEQVSIDLHGNETRSQTRISGGGSETRIVNTPDSNQDAVTVMVDGRVTSSTSATGLTTTYGYDGLGRRTTVVAPRTGASETHYDAHGRVDYVKDAAGNQTSFAYDPSTGRKTRETNALGKHSYFAYDARGQLTRTWGDVPYPVQYDYDAYGRRAQMYTYREDAGWSSETWPEAAHGDPTRWHYDEATGLLASKEDAAGKAVTYTYGPAGRLATRTWARQKAGGGPLRTSYAYDPATSELIGVDYNDDTPGVTYTYDRLGRQTTVTDAVGTRVFAYDPQTLQLDTETIAGLTPAVLKRHYDPASVKGRLVGIQSGENYTVGYGYDQSGRMQGVSWTANGQSDVAIYSRVAGNELLAGYVTQSGLATVYSYEPKRDLKTQVANRWNGTTVSQYDYRYDSIGRRSSVENSGSAFGPTKFTSWGYDERNQATASKRYMGSFTANPNAANEVAPERRGYAFDPIGNRESALDQDGVTSISYTPNELNQYDAVGQQSPQYDEDGNLLKDGTKVLSYNAENQLKSVTVPGVSVSTYDYDYLGRRVKKSVHVLDGGSADYVNTWVYDGWNAVQESKSVGGGTATTKSFVWGLDLAQSMDGVGGIGGLVAVVDEAGSQMEFLYDAQGNVSQLLDERGALVARYEYDAFGQTLLEDGPQAAGNNHRFSSKYLDPESRFYYYGYRFYSPMLGRWISRDPMGEAGSISLYGYVGGDPINGLDALGLFDFRGFVDGAWDYLTEPFKIVVDIGAVGGSLAYNAYYDDTSEPEFFSMLGRTQAARMNGGQSTLEAALKGSAEMVANVVTGGGVGVAMNIGENVGAYYVGEISLEQLDYNLSHGAGGQVVATATAMGMSRSTGSGWLGKGAPNPAQEQQMIDNLIEARNASGKTTEGNATFGQVAEGSEQTPVFESADYQTTFRRGHSEAQGLAASAGKGARTVAVDQKPCGVCRLRLQAASYRGAVRVVIPKNPELATQGPKTVAIKAARGKASPVPATHQVIGFKVTLICDQDESWIQ